MPIQMKNSVTRRVPKRSISAPTWIDRNTARAERARRPHAVAALCLAALPEKQPAPGNGRFADMRSVNLAAAALAAFCLAYVLSPGIARADAAAGARMALQWCANCHVVNGKGPSATVQQGPPAFRT